MGRFYEYKFFFAACLLNMIFFTPILFFILQYSNFPTFVDVFLILLYVAIVIHSNWQLTKIIYRKEELEN